MSYLDTMFNAAAALTSIPCTASGTNAISLTPLVNCPALSSYNELGGYRFRAVGNSTGAVTAQYNGLGFLPVYHADGVTQANVADLSAGQQYVLTYSLALNSGLGGFFLESPSAPVTTGATFQPGGRLTFQSATPVMFTNQLAQQIIYYAPYQHNLVPIYNGSTVQMYQFTSSLSDQVGLQLNMAGSANWPLGTLFDVFVTLNGGVPTLCTGPAWSGLNTRSLTLSVFGGFLTNTGATTMRISAAATIPVAANQATFVGTFVTSANGQSQWQFGGRAATGIAGTFYLCNYYNPVMFSSLSGDSTSYTYSSGTIRGAHNATNMGANFIQCSSERSFFASDIANVILTASIGANCTTGIGIQSTTTYSQFSLAQAWSANGINTFLTTSALCASNTGWTTINSLESGDASSTTTFNTQANHNLWVDMWL